jgi:hypothetical protein
VAEVILYKRGAGNDIIASVVVGSDSAQLLSLGLGATPAAGSGTITLADAGGSAAYIQIADGSSAAVSGANASRIRYNETDDLVEVSENTGAYHRLVPFANSATATADTTTTSATDVAVNSMTLTTPPAATYLVMFTGSVDHSANNGTIDTSIYSGGAQVASSERAWSRGSGQGDVTTSFACVAIVTVDGTDDIEGQWRTSGATATMHERTLHIVEVRT